jgi:uncharacterized membrane protein
MEQHDDAPKRARRDDKVGELAIVGRAVLISQPRQELFDFWRDFSNFPAFMKAVKSVDVVEGTRSVWTIDAPAGHTVTLETEIIAESPGESIAWRSLENSQIKTRGEVRFTDAPAGRGTIVTAEIGYEPPGGDLGRLIAKLFASEPNIQARHELKRFKMLMETGEIATGAFSRSEEDDE